MKIMVCDACGTQIRDPEEVWYLSCRRSIAGRRKECELCPACLARVRQVIGEEADGHGG